MVSVFILPPSVADLEKRLHTRAQDSDDVIRGRMDRAAHELSHWAEYDYIVINQNVDEAFAEVQSILKAEQLKRERRTGLTAFVRELQRQLETIAFPTSLRPATPATGFPGCRAIAPRSPGACGAVAAGCRCGIGHPAAAMAEGYHDVGRILVSTPERRRMCPNLFRFPNLTTANPRSPANANAPASPPSNIGMRIRRCLGHRSADNGEAGWPGLAEPVWRLQ